MTEAESRRGAPVDVLVVGAGPVGLTTALALQNDGVSLRIVDKHPTWSRLSKAMTLTPRTLECFAMIGVAERCLEEGILSRRIHHYTERGRKIAVTDLTAADSELAGLLHLSQAKTIEILVGALARGGGRVERGVALLDVAGGPGDYRARVAHADGSIETIAAKFVVGADGSRSRVRGCIGAAFDGEEQRETFIMADIVLRGFPYDPEDRHVFYVTGTFLTILPIDGVHYRLISTCGLPAAGLDERFVIRRFQELLGAVGLGAVALGEPFWIARFNPRQYVADRFRHEGIFLVGDAAHIQSPIGAQGLNTGIQDALNLAWKLAIALRGGAGDALLESYQDERYPVARRLFEYNDAISERVFGRNWLKRRALRYGNYLLRWPRYHASEVEKISQMHVDYGGRGLVIDEAPRAGLSAAARPGRRMGPCDLVGADGARFDLLRATGARAHVLLAFGDDRACVTWARALRGRVERTRGIAPIDVFAISDRPSPRQRFLAPAGDGVLYDRAARFRARVGIEAGSAILVRPDGHVAARFAAGDDAPLDTYLRRLGCAEHR